MRPVPKPKNPWESFRYAIEGIVHVYRTQRHMRIHFTIVALVLVLGVLCHFDATQMALLVIVCAGVLVMEMVNTAVESVVDMVTQSYHPLAKLAKDIAAGAVLIAAICAALVGFILFFGSRKILSLSVAIGKDPVPLVALIGVVIVILLIGRLFGGKGDKRGGIISVPVAISFLLAVTIIYHARFDYLSAFLAVLLVVIVAQSRPEGKVYTFQEVIIGGLLGICLTTGIYYLALMGRH